ncbi:PilN domain-containing protein [Granulicella arctica]|uniref:Type IV pilus assembly protein PilN n=1 Tax=Granulicella arctica TaxID=940613 RepID=A0A7Y9PD75_9BACT|nr:PilN domain-containing protein [Granulicella arctica]NYF77776.1 type IV pilus assembly protein PilN [Granulicella arctica]
MRITINLATRPFVELRPLFARLRLAMAALVVLAVIFGIALHLLNAKASAAQAQMDALKAKTSNFEQERHSNEARMRQPQNMSVLERSQFLNALFAQKSFSWTAVMMDLETVLPAGVQVTSIEPQITKDGDVLIRLRVSGDRDRAVQLVRNLETSHRFLAPRLSNETAQTHDTGNGLAGGPRGVRPAPVETAGIPGGVEFDILSGYNPLPALPVKAAKKASDETPDTKQPASGSQKTTHPKAVAPKAAPVKPSIVKGTTR